MSINITESRLHEALKRLLSGQPQQVKVLGKLTLNKINKEAGLGNSYIHKFPAFVEFAKPLINEFNLKREMAIVNGFNIDVVTPLSDLDKLKSDIARERKLKDKYRLERDNAIVARKLLEEKYSMLIFRFFELQDELETYYTSVTPIKK